MDGDSWAVSESVLGRTRVELSSTVDLRLPEWTDSSVGEALRVGPIPAATRFCMKTLLAFIDTLGGLFHHMLDVRSRDEVADLRERIAALEAKVEIIEKRTT